MDDVEVINREMQKFGFWNFSYSCNWLSWPSQGKGVENPFQCTVMQDQILQIYLNLPVPWVMKRRFASIVERNIVRSGFIIIWCRILKTVIVFKALTMDMTNVKKVLHD